MARGGGGIKTTLASLCSAVVLTMMFQLAAAAGELEQIGRAHV